MSEDVKTSVEQTSVDTKMLMAILPRGAGNDFVSFARSKGAPGATIILGKGTANNKILQLLAIGDTKKDIVIMLLNRSVAHMVAEQYESYIVSKKKNFLGVIFCVDIEHFLKPSNKMFTKIERGEGMMSYNHNAIMAIIPSGYSEEVMSAARKAGARGGTVLTARGTGTAEDIKFFDMTIVPEKEIVVIISPKDTTEIILETIKNQESLQQPGTGIVFTMPIESFWSLGGNANKEVKNGK